MGHEANQTAPLNAFVYMIESPSSDDLFDGRTEGRVLWEALDLAGVRSWYRLAVGEPQFDRALGGELLAAAKHYQAHPILHLSMHGSSDGVRFTDGTFMTWDQLRSRLVPINTALRTTPSRL